MGVMLKLLSLMAITCMAFGGFRVSEASVVCNDVVRYLIPCLQYVSNGGNVPTVCCNGIKTLYGQLKTTTDRRDVCNCLKRTISGISIPPKSLALAAGLPAQCGVNIPYKISPTTDCKSVQ